LYLLTGNGRVPGRPRQTAPGLSRRTPMTEALLLQCSILEADPQLRRDGPRSSVGASGCHIVLAEATVRCRPGTADCRSDDMLDFS
jgi:hypothetical protein